KVPPLDVITRKVPTLRAFMSSSTRARYAETAGRRYASTVVVLVRSNSRNTGSTSQLVATGTAGNAWRSAAASRCSWLGGGNENSRATAMASGATRRA